MCVFNWKAQMYASDWLLLNRLSSEPHCSHFVPPDSGPAPVFQEFRSERERLEPRTHGRRRRGGGGYMVFRQVVNWRGWMVEIKVNRGAINSGQKVKLPCP